MGFTVSGRTGEACAREGTTQSVGARVPEPDYAVVEIQCTRAQVRELAGIPNLEIEVRPLFTEDPDVVLVSALADEAAQQAVAALGCTVTVVLSASAYRAQVDDAYEGLEDENGPIA